MEKPRPPRGRRGYKLSSPRLDDKKRAFNKRAALRPTPRVDDEVLADYRFLLSPLDPKTMDPLPFPGHEEEGIGATLRESMESVKVKTERPGEYVQFIFRPKQEELYEIKMVLWHRGRPAKVIILKTRRYGMTTYEVIESIILMLRVPGWCGVTIAKDDKDARKFFAIARETINQIPLEVLANFGIEVVTFTKSEMRIRHGKFRESAYAILTANSEGGLDRGGTNNKLHPTEAPHYRRRAQEEYNAAQPTLGEFPGNSEVCESTAGGYDPFFKPWWDDAHWPGEDDGISDFERLFIGAHEHPNYYRPFEDDADRQRLIDTLGTIDRFGGRQEQVDFDTILPPYQRESPWHDDHSEEAAYERALEQANYARYLVVDKCKPQGLPRRRQEYPYTPEEAFQATGTPFFDVELVNAWLRIVVDGPRYRLVVQKGQVYPVRDPKGMWMIRKLPEPEISYCYGADTASGVRRHADGQAEGDFPTCHIGDVVSGYTMAELRAHIPPREHAMEVAKGSLLYGKAPGYVERAPHGDEGSMLARMEPIEIGGWFAIQSVLYSTRLVWSDKPGHPRQPKIGFETRKGTKRPLMEGLKDFLEVECSTPSPGAFCPLTRETLKEMLHYSRTQTDSGHVKLEASKGHDDCATSSALMLKAREVLLTHTDLQTKVEERPDEELLFYEQLWDSQTEVYRR